MEAVDCVPGRKTIAVVGTSSPSRSVAIATLLADCVERHGWAERFLVLVGGLGGGAGSADTADIGMLAHDGYRPISSTCVDVGRQHALLEQAQVFVVASDDDACLFLEWPEAEGKHILALTDYLDADAWAIEDPESGFRDFMDEVSEAVPSLVRFLTAHPGP